MKPPAIIEAAIDIASVSKRVHLAHIAVQDAERAEEAATKTAERKREDAARARLELGRALIEARKAWPARGPRAKGWGDFLRDQGIEERSARRYMELAGFVSDTGDDVSEIPTYAEAGITRPRTTDAPADRERAKPAPAAPAELDATPGRAPAEGSTASEIAQGVVDSIDGPTDEQREAAYRREVESSLPPRMEERQRDTHELVAFVAEARAKLREITARDIHLTSVTTSPEDFMRAKQMLIDIVNLCLEELSQAGVLDGKEQRRQMRLLKGGIQ